MTHSVRYSGDDIVCIKSEEHSTDMIELDKNLVNAGCLLARCEVHGRLL